MLSAEEFAELSEELRAHFKKWPTIDRVQFHEYSVLVGISGLDIASIFKIEAWEGDVLLYELDADYRKRSAAGFRLCEIIGEDIANCTFRNTELVLTIVDGYDLVFRRNEDGESYEIMSSSPEIGIAVI